MNHVRFAGASEGEGSREGPDEERSWQVRVPSLSRPDRQPGEGTLAVYRAFRLSRRPGGHSHAAPSARYPEPLLRNRGFGDRRATQPCDQAFAEADARRFQKVVRERREADEHRQVQRELLQPFWLAE